MHAFAVLGPLALAGLFLLRKREGWLPAAFPLLGAVLLALVYTAPATVRLLALPSLALLSSAALHDLFSALRRGCFKRAASIIVAAAICALAVNLAAPRLSGAQPSEANDQRLLGVVYEIQGKGSLALSQYDRAKAMAPRNSACRLSLGAMLASDGVAEEAERQFLTAAALDTLSPTPHLGLANLYRRNGLLEQSLQSLQAALQRAPYDVGLAISIGRSCVEMGLYEQAKTYFRAALEIDPENISAIDGLIELRERGVHVRVRDRAEGTEETASDKIQRAMALLRQGDIDGARQILDDALAIDPDDLDVVFADATWHLTAGEVEKAIEGYERCHEFNPRNIIVMNNLAAAYQQVGKTEDAIALWRRILKLDPANAKAKANLKTIESENSGSATE
jgi:tetratricopeptide (TPR) repeat protein